jgi:magnesium-transporting ATPase (P-type)
MHVTKVARCVLTDVSTLLLTILLSAFATLHSHIPAALTFIQIVTIELLILAWPVAYFVRDKNAKHQREPLSVAGMEITVFAVLAASLAYGNYLLFYSRHTIDPAYMDPANPLHAHATTVTLATVALCGLINIKLVSLSDKKHVFRKESLENELVKRLLVAVAVLLVIVYFPLSHTVLGTKNLSVGDWLFTLFCAGVYGGFRLLQRQTKLHSRHAVIELHKDVNKHK